MAKLSHLIRFSQSYEILFKQNICLYKILKKKIKQYCSYSVVFGSFLYITNLQCDFTENFRTV